MAFLACCILSRVGVVRRLDLGGIHFDARRQRIERQHDVFDLGLLGCLECALILLVIRLHLSVIDLDRLHERLGIDRSDRDFALLFQQRQIALGRCTGHDVAVDHWLLQWRQHELAADALLELQRRHPLRLQHLLVSLRREFAVDLKGRQLCDEFEELGIGDAKAVGARAVLEQPLVDELVHERVARFGRVEQ